MLDSHVAVITGGLGLLGTAFVKEVLSHGGLVAVADINIEDDESKANNHNLQSERTVFVKTDITKSASLENLIDKVHQKFGKIDSLVNNAYPRNPNYGNSLLNVQYDDFCENINLHLGGYFLASQCFMKYFIEHGGGNIVNIASVYGLIPPRFEIYKDSNMDMPVEYAVIKSGVIHLTKYMAKYSKGKDIRVNCISPGGIFNNQPKLFIDNYNNHCLNKGMLSPHDVAGALIFLLSEKSKYINGQNLIVDDGFTL